MCRGEGGGRLLAYNKIKKVQLHTNKYKEKSGSFFLRQKTLIGLQYVFSQYGAQGNSKNVLNLWQ